MSVNVALEALTIDEIELVENLTQRPIETILNEDVPKGRVLKALVFILRKRENPEFTIEDAGKYSLTEAMEVFGALADPKG